MKPTVSGKRVCRLGWAALGLALAAVAVRPVCAADEARAEKYLGPSVVAAAKDGRTLYVGCADSREVAWVDLTSGQVTRRVGVPAEPTGIALTPDGTRLIVTCAAAKSTVVILDAAAGTVRGTLTAGHTATGPAISPDGTRLYVCNRFNNDVSVFDLSAGAEVTRIPAVREPIAAAVTPDGREVWVANHLPLARTDGDYEGRVSPFVTVFDAQTFSIAAIELTSGSNSLRGLTISPDGSYAFVPHVLSNFLMVPFRVDSGWINVNVLSIIDVRQRRVIRTIGLDDYDHGAGNPWQVACTSDGKWVGVSLSGTHELSCLETQALLGELARNTMSPMTGVWPIYPSLGKSLWRRVALPGQGPRGAVAVGSKMCVAEYFQDAVAIVDLAAPQAAPVRTIPLGPPPKSTLERRGEMLFHDATLCYQQWQSCASCHPDGRIDALNWDLMNDGVGNPKNTKSLLLAHRTPPAMAEGVRMSAEEAVRSGISHILFADRPEPEAVAIDAYLKSLKPIPSPHLIDGRLSPAAERGRALFHSEQLGCQRCHPAPLYTDMRRHGVGSRSRTDYNDRFDTPTLIEVWRTAPYLHDGRYTTLKALFAEGRHGLRRGMEGDLSEADLDALVAFVASL